MPIFPAVDASGRFTSTATQTHIGSLSGVLRLESQSGVDVTGATDSAAGFRAALTRAASLGLMLVGASGTVRIDTSVTIGQSVDLRGVTISCKAAGAVVVGQPTVGQWVRALSVELGVITNPDKPTSGWQVAGRAGLTIVNLYSSQVSFRVISGFDVGVSMDGRGHGVSYVTLNCGHLDNNKINWRTAPDAAGWSNQNTIIGGRFSHNSNEGVAVPGTKHIHMAAAPNNPNGNNFVGCSIESPKVVEYAIDCGGNDNMWTGCRFEDTRGNSPVMWRATAVGNVILYGFMASQITQTKETGAYANNIHARSSTSLTGDGSGDRGVLNLNSAYSNTSHALRVLDTTATDSTSASLRWGISGQAIEGRYKGDAYPRISIESSGKISTGTGGAALNSSLTLSNGILLLTGVPASAAPANTATPARWMTVYVDGVVYRTPLYQ